MNIKKRIIFLLTLAIILSLTAPAYAKNGNWSGSGTAESPYIIEDEADMERLTNALQLNPQALNKIHFTFAIPAATETTTQAAVTEPAATEPAITTETPLLPATYSGFEDVNKGDYFYDAVTWAASNGFVSGTDATHFSPSVAICRAQLITILWKSAGSPEPASLENPFVDVAEGSYYYKAVLWGYQKGYIAGTSATVFSPSVSINRAQAITVLARYNGIRDNGGGYVKRYVDVPRGSYFSNAVAWATINKIATGLDETHFYPGAECNRAQAVLFLYKAVVKQQ